MALETMLWWETALLALYVAVLAALAIYGLHRYHLVLLHRRHRREGCEPASRFPAEPLVTVQLPLFNERYVAQRLIEAVCALDWPRDRLEIQVLDDSTDDTRTITAALVDRKRAEGFDITHIHRTDRTGYKAGALENGLRQAKGDLVAIFDADFVPTPELLRRTVDHFTDPTLGMIQVRWDHLNREHSLLTQIQALMLDGHFVVEHTARHRSGRFFNFNGTAGIWRRRCIEEAGGWQHDTLTEDLDLSYRAQIAGWRFLYLPDILAPAELPMEMNAFKSQQHRWTKGSIQTGIKLLPRLWRAPLPHRVKVEATFHLTDNLSYLLMIALALLLGPVLAIREAHLLDWTWLFDVPLLLCATGAVTVFYLAAMEGGTLPWWRRALLLPALMALGIGLAVNNAKAVLEAMLRHETPFIRTPKRADAARPGLGYHAKRNLLPLIEVGLGVWFCALIVTAWQSGQWPALPFLALFAAGFLMVGLMSAPGGRAMQSEKCKIQNGEHPGAATT